MPFDRGIRDREMRMMQLKQRREEVQIMLADLDSMIANFNEEIDDEIELSQMVDKYGDCPRLDADEHPTVIMETGNWQKVPYFFSEYKKIKHHLYYEAGKKGFNWEVAEQVANICKRPLLYIQYIWTEELDDDFEVIDRYPTFYVEAANQYAKDKFAEIGIKQPYLACSELVFVRLSYALRDKDFSDIDKTKYDKRKTVKEHFWKGLADGK